MGGVRSIHRKQHDDDDDDGDDEDDDDGDGLSLPPASALSTAGR